MGAIRGRRLKAYEPALQDVGRAIQLGVELLIIADIVQTITIDQLRRVRATLQSES